MQQKRRVILYRFVQAVAALLLGVYVAAMYRHHGTLGHNLTMAIVNAVTVTLMELSVKMTKELP